MPENDEKTEWELLPPLVQEALGRELKRAHQHYNLARFQTGAVSSLFSSSSSSSSSAKQPKAAQLSPRAAQRLQANSIIPLNFASSGPTRAAQSLFKPPADGKDKKKAEAAAPPTAAAAPDAPITATLASVPGFRRRLATIPATSDLVHHLCELLLEREPDSEEDDAKYADLSVHDKRAKQRERAAWLEQQRKRPIKSRLAEWSGITVDVSKPLVEQRRAIARQFTSFFDDFDAWTKPAFRLLTQLVGLKVIMPEAGSTKLKKKAASVKKGSSAYQPKPRRERDVSLGEHQSRVACYVAMQIVCPSAERARTIIDYHALKNEELFEFGY